MSTTPTIGLTHSGHSFDHIDSPSPSPSPLPQSQSQSQSHHKQRTRRGRRSRPHSTAQQDSQIPRYVPPLPKGFLDHDREVQDTSSHDASSHDSSSRSSHSSTMATQHAPGYRTPPPRPAATNGGDREQDPLLPADARNNGADPAARKSDSINRKLRTYTALLALRNGCMPDTAQLAAWGRCALRSSVLDSRNRRLSPKGREMVRDVRAWVEALVDLAQAKNYDDKIQEFIWFTRRAGVKAEGVPDVGGVARAPSGAGKDARKVLDKMRQLVELLWTSDAFRGLLNEFAGE